jgi:hypothetical protein
MGRFEEKTRAFPSPSHPMTSLHSRFALISTGHRQGSRTSMPCQNMIERPHYQADAAEPEFRARGSAAPSRQNRQPGTSPACSARNGQRGCKERSKGRYARSLTGAVIYPLVNPPAPGVCQWPHSLLLPNHGYKRPRGMFIGGKIAYGFSCIMKRILSE